MSPSVSPRMDNLLYHDYLQGRPLSTCSTSSSEPSSLHNNISTSSPPSFNWDLLSKSRPLLPALDYISQKLSKHNLHIALIISDHAPSCIPIWPLPLESQLLLTRTIRKACSKYTTPPNWMTSLASLTPPTLPTIFTPTPSPATAYLTQRSLIQNETIYTSQNLHLLTIDHIHTLKSLLHTLTKPAWLPAARATCLLSAAHLLHRIHAIHTATPLKKSYLARAYPSIPFHPPTFDEVVAAHAAEFPTAAIHDLSSVQDLTFSLPLPPPPPLPVELQGTPPAGELPSLSPHTTASTHYGDEEEMTPISPLQSVDVSTLDSWTSPLSSPESGVSGVTVRYPAVPKPASGGVEWGGEVGSPVGSLIDWALEGGFEGEEGDFEEEKGFEEEEGEGFFEEEREVVLEEVEVEPLRISKRANTFPAALGREGGLFEGVESWRRVVGGCERCGWGGGGRRETVF